MKIIMCLKRVKYIILQMHFGDTNTLLQKNASVCVYIYIYIYIYLAIVFSVIIWSCVYGRGEEAAALSRSLVNACKRM